MRFVQKWSYSCAHGLASATNENHQRRAVYYYGFHIIIGSLVKWVITIAISLLLGILLPMLVILTVFSSMRMLAGGYHMDTYGKCLFVSLIMFVFASLIDKYTYLYWSTPGIIILISLMMAVGTYAIVRYAPKDTPNKPITDPEKIRKFKRLSMLYLFILLSAVSILAFLNLNFYVIAICFGVILELFTITPAGHKFFDNVRDSLGSKKKSHC